MTAFAGHLWVIFQIHSLCNLWCVNFNFSNESRVMDPHSRLSQFNQRTPKTGPSPSHNARFMDPSSRQSLNKSKSPQPSTPPSLSPRPIATNSRIKQDEKYRRDMYLACVDNALHQKANVRCSFPDNLDYYLNPSHVHIHRAMLNLLTTSSTSSTQRGRPTMVYSSQHNFDSGLLPFHM